VAEPWYEDEDGEFRDKLKDYDRRPSDHGRAEEEKRTPEENMAVIRLYGGVQFPGGRLQETPRRILLAADKRKKRAKGKANGGERDSGIESQSVSPRQAAASELVPPSNVKRVFRPRVCVA